MMDIKKWINIKIVNNIPQTNKEFKKSKFKKVYNRESKLIGNLMKCKELGGFITNSF